jgi:hypothetical protein
LKPEPERDSAAAVPRDPIGLFGGIDATVSTAVAPVAMVSASPYLGWRMLRVSFLHANSGDVPAGALGTASVSWTAGRIDACPLQLREATLGAYACARLEVGELSATGVTVPSARDRSDVWVAAGPLVRVEWTVFGPVFLDAEAALSFRVTQDRVYVLPDSTVEQVPLLGVTGGAGAGVHFL